MCGLFGVVAPLEQVVSREAIEVFLHLGRQAQRRGSDASGLVRVDGGGDIHVVKSDLDFSTLAKSGRTKALLGADHLQTAVAVFGHSRLETHGFSASVANNQPVIVGDWVVLHNGIITNHLRIRADHDALATGQPESDTAAIGILLSDWHQRGREEPLDDVFGRLEGEFSIIAVSTFGDVLCHTNVGNLYFASQPDRSLLIASEPRQFSAEARALRASAPGPNDPVAPTGWRSRFGSRRGSRSVQVAIVQGCAGTSPAGS